MNCCNNDCNQGRDCPNRVAKIKRRDYDREALPPSIWLYQLRKLAQWMLTLFVFMILTAIFLPFAFAKVPDSTCEKQIAKWKTPPAHLLLKCKK